ncbi:MAG: AAA family ATPase [Actinophytocola sp.]|nr:AAA family ATPase [Actinophytocola sp.]
MGEVAPDALSEHVRLWAGAGEQYDVEFKSERRKPLNDHDLVEVAVCLANGSGGVLLVGVEDDGAVTGARHRHGAKTDPLRVQAVIANNTQPPLATVVNLVSVDGVSVLVVEVPDSAQVVGTTKGTYLRRTIGADGMPRCMPFYAHEMLARQIDYGAVDFASLPARGATWEDLDPLEFERVRRLVREAGSRADAVLADLPDLEIARALGVARNDDDVTNGALLLFGRAESLRKFIPTHEAAFQVLRGLEVQTNEFFTSPLFRLAEDMFSRFAARNHEEELEIGMFRVPVPAFSATAFREALANALTHRDYTRRGAVHVQWTEDQLEITSSGGFPEGVDVDNFLVAAPHPRSPLLADAFKRTGLVERTGRGISRMFAEQLRVGRQAPDYGRTTPFQVTALLPGGPANLAMTRWVLEQEQQGDRTLSVPELQILSELLRERRATTTELAHLLQRTEGETRSQLARMVERGWVEARGDGKGRTWHLSAAVYRALESSAGYVRARGFDPLQQEQMVLAYVDAYGRVTRSQVAELCAMAPRQATYLLGRLVNEGKLQREGERKSAYYTRSS